MKDWKNQLKMNIKNHKTKLLKKKAVNLIPAFTQLLSKNPNRFDYNVWPTYYIRAKGVFITDNDNNKFLDMSIASIGSVLTEYADKDIDGAVIKSIQNGVSSSLINVNEVKLAEKLCKMHKWSDQIRFCKSGGEAMSIAVRIARARSGKDKVLFSGYHGWHDWYMSANLKNNNNLNNHLFNNINPLGVPKVLKNTAIPFRFYDNKQLINLIKKYKNKIAAIIVEPIRNDEPNKIALENIYKIAKKNSIILIFDEISSGFRICNGGSHLKLKVNPDIAVFGKGLGNGYPIAAILGRKEIMKICDKIFISSTNWMEATGYTAALSTIKKFEKRKLYKKLIANGKKVKKIWLDVAKKYNVKINTYGIDPLAKFDFKYSKTKNLIAKKILISTMIENKILASNIYYAMSAHTDNHFKKFSKSLELAFLRISKKIN